MPIAGDRSVHVEYVPPQVVTEYVRTEFRHEGLPVDGIRYGSARHEGGTSLVLFASQENLAGPKDVCIGSVFSGPERWIQLVGWNEREVTEADAETWDRETPRAFEWDLYTILPKRSLRSVGKTALIFQRALSFR